MIYRPLYFALRKQGVPADLAAQYSRGDIDILPMLARWAVRQALQSIIHTPEAQRALKEKPTV